KSALNCTELHKAGNEVIADTPKPPESSPTSFSGYIPMDQIQFSYSTSSGPGGQNVNKLNTKVELRFHLDSASWIPEEARNKMKDLCRNKINQKGTRSSCILLFLISVLIILPKATYYH